MEPPPEFVDRVLERWPVARLATLRADGAAHLVPIVFARSDARLWMPVDAKPKRGGELARVRHVRRDPRVALLLDAWDPDWTRLWWVRVDGEAEIREGEAAATPEARRALAALRAKYPQYSDRDVLRADRILVAIRPVRTRAWCATSRALGGEP